MQRHQRVLTRGRQRWLCVCVRERDWFEDTRLTALKMKERAISQEMQAATKSWKRQGTDSPPGPPKGMQPLISVEWTAAAAAAKSLQSCPTLWDPIDGSPPGSPIPGILQARTLEWVAISFSNAWKWKVKAKPLSRVQLLVTPWTAAYQAPPSMGFSRQECWSGVPLPSLQWSETDIQNCMTLNFWCFQFMIICHISNK